VNGSARPPCDIQEEEAQGAENPALHDVRGYLKLYRDHLNEADQGCDLGFLVDKSGAPVARESH
jgi:dihydroxy-acid dehydratase